MSLAIPLRYLSATAQHAQDVVDIIFKTAHSDVFHISLLAALSVFATFFIISTIIGPNNLLQACKAILNGIIFAVSILLPASILTFTTLSVFLLAFITFLACYSVYIGHDHPDISPFADLQTERGRHSFKIILDTHVETFPGVFVFFAGLLCSVTLLSAYIHYRRKYRNDIRARVAERLAACLVNEREILKGQRTIQRSVKQLADVDASLVCLICVDRFTQPYTLAPCGHTFDLECLQGWFRAAHPSPADEELALTLDRRGSLFTLRRQKFCPLCHAEVGGCPTPARGLMGLGMEPPEEGSPWRGLFVEVIMEPLTPVTVED
ncbi:hypothetical protein B0H19DRAFT_1268558 [Mycena capillaripes]|nr:hypothetical protein B0H19DRAFT_1268558 [Mycena capillaripes]